MTLINFNNKTNNIGPSFSNILDSLFSDAVTRNKMADRYPNVNISENKTGHVIDLAVPGLKKEDFKIDLKKNKLTVWMEVKKDGASKNFTHKEFDYGCFSRSFNLPDGADDDKITAEYKDGILSISIGKKDDTKLLHKEIIVL